MYISLPYFKYLRNTIIKLESEITRLKEGRFTEEEFQNLCHNMDVNEGYNAFVTGCNEYQKKLFGHCQNEDWQKRLIFAVGFQRRMNNDKTLITWTDNESHEKNKPTKN